MQIIYSSNRLRLLLLLFVLCSFGAQAESEVFSDNDGAIRGYDPVAYFTEGKAVKGDAGITYEYHGGVWHFVNEANRDVFVGNPEKYAPQYGGHCAFGLAQGHLVQTDPHAWTIVDGKLYLNFSKAVRNTWQKDIPGNLKRSDANWKQHGY